MHAQDLVVEVLAGVQLHHLPDLLLDGHPAEQVGDALGDGQGGVQVGSGHGAILSRNLDGLWFSAAYSDTSRAAEDGPRPEATLECT